jgi:hypothetical protein
MIDDDVTNLEGMVEGLICEEIRDVLGGGRR